MKPSTRADYDPEMTLRIRKAALTVAEFRHYAGERISIDLEDGAKHNDRKLGNLLAEAKSITGKK